MRLTNLIILIPRQNLINLNDIQTEILLDNNALEINRYELGTGIITFFEEKSKGNSKNILNNNNNLNF